MKTTFKALAVLVIIINSQSCTKSDTSSPTSTNTVQIPFQGPQNPSFETPNTWVGGLTYQTGTGFMPSNGVYYAQLTGPTSTYGASYAASMGGDPSVEFYQDGVDLSHSTTMTFDYTFTYQPATNTTFPYLYYKQTATIEILFTANGTQTLWSQTIDSTNLGSLPIQKLNQTITLPSLPTAGRLLIVGYTDFTTNNSNSSYSSPSFTFCMDNIRVN